MKETQTSEQNLPSSIVTEIVASRLEILTRMKKLDIYHQSEYWICGVRFRSLKYTVYGDRSKNFLFKAIKQLHRFRSPELIKGLRFPLLLYDVSGEPVLEIHFGSLQKFEFTPSSVLVTLPNNVVIGSLTVTNDEGTTTLMAFDAKGQFLYDVEDTGVTTAGDTLHNVIMNSEPIAKVRSGRDSSAITFIGNVSVDIRALLLATVIWLEMIERKRLRCRRQSYL